MAPAATESKACVHCATPFRPSERQPDFCCSGCQFVHDLIERHGLTQFYNLQPGTLPPVKPFVFQKRDYAWLSELAAEAETREVPSLTLDLQGLSCLGCVWLVENLYQRHPGALAIHVDPAIGRCEMKWRKGAFDPAAFAAELQSFGYLAGPPGKSAPESRALHLRMGLCGALAMNSMLFSLPHYLGMADDFAFAPLFRQVALVLATLSMLVGGSYFFIRSFHSLRRGVLHIDLPISLGLIAAYAGSVYAFVQKQADLAYCDFVSVFVFLMLVGRWLQQKAVERNRNLLLAARGGPPDVVLTATGVRVAATELEPGTEFLVPPGHLVPVRARLESAAATLGLEWINGESEPAHARRGRTVPSGATNCSQQPIALAALEPWTASLLCRLTQIAPAGDSRNRPVERFLRTYLGVVLVVAAVGFAAWWFFSGSLVLALQILVSVLVVSCPCASGVALPLADDLATSLLRRAGIFVRNARIWPRIRDVRRVVFDKTGTLSLETLSLRNPEALDALGSRERSVLLSLVQDSHHPVSGALREQLLAAGTPPATSERAVEHVGHGLELHVLGSAWRLGRPEWSGGAGDCTFTRDGEPLAAFAFAEQARPGAARELDELRGRGLLINVLSGDRRAKVEAMAARLGLAGDACVAELTPDEKAAWVREHDRNDTLFLGDGANDSLAFDAAWCTGTPAVDRGLLEQKADFYFLGRGLSGLRALLDAADRRRGTVRRVVAFAITYNLVAVAVSLAGHMNPLVAAVIMPLSSLVSLAIVYAGLHPRALDPMAAGTEPGPAPGPLTAAAAR
jgi:Cu2+-exporting ATPase